MTTGPIVPALQLRDPAGSWVSLGQHKERRLVLAVEEHCPKGFRSGLTEHYPEYRALAVEVLGITRRAGARSYPFPGGECGVPAVHWHSA